MQLDDAHAGTANYDSANPSKKHEYKQHKADNAHCGYHCDLHWSQTECGRLSSSPITCHSSPKPKSAGGADAHGKFSLSSAAAAAAAIAAAAAFFADNFAVWIGHITASCKLFEFGGSQGGREASVELLREQYLAQNWDIPVQIRSIAVFKTIHGCKNMKYMIEELRKKYPDRVPCIVRFDGHVMKFMVPEETNGSAFIVCMRAQLKRKKYISLTADRAIFVFHDGKLLPGTVPLSDLDIDKTKPLMLDVQLENVFG